MDCLFCNIASGQIPATIIYQDDHTIALLDIHPRSPGHTLVIPKIHAADLIDLPESETGPLFLTVRRITAILEEALKPAGFTIGINHGEEAGQAVGHLHVHLIPRFKGDKGGNIHSVVNNPPKESLEKIAANIKSKLS